jgi:hypothetical protein
MTQYDAVGIAEGFIEPESEEQVIEAWHPQGLRSEAEQQYLHDTQLAYRLQGWFGRTAQNLLEQGIIQ